MQAPQQALTLPRVTLLAVALACGTARASDEELIHLDAATVQARVTCHDEVTEEIIPLVHCLSADTAEEEGVVGFTHQGRDTFFSAEWAGNNVNRRILFFRLNDPWAVAVVAGPNNALLRVTVLLPNGRPTTRQVRQRAAVEITQPPR